MTWDIFLDAHPRIASGRCLAARAATDRSSATGAVRSPQENRPRRWNLLEIGLSQMQIQREIYIAYERAADAAKLGTLVRAKPLGFSIQWLSQSAFQLDRATQQMIMDALKA